jgi:sporadic carbohydrate cluster 2OG-Fe(II) oxygenase
MGLESFMNSAEQRLGDEFLESGFIIRKCESFEDLQGFYDFFVHRGAAWLEVNGSSGGFDALHTSHIKVVPEKLNDLRLHLFAELNAVADTRRKYFRLASSLVQTIVGNELAMQNKVNLSIQQPGDQTSVLELHSDVWAGDSPFQVVLWVPLTDSTDTNAMFLLPPGASSEAYRRARCGKLTSMAEIQEEYKDRFLTIEVGFGEVLLFDSNCLHGNQLNTTSSSRWSLNCRLTSLLAPSTNPERRLGSFYTPILVRPASRMGLRAMEVLGIADGEN